MPAGGPSAGESNSTCREASPIRSLDDVVSDDAVGDVVRMSCKRELVGADEDRLNAFSDENWRSEASERMRLAIDSDKVRQLYSQRLGTVEPVFGNIRHNKHLTRFNLRGREKVNTQWQLYCMVHNIEKLANSGWRQ